jgi:prepilin-type N-terminal cleavage/methylation domain-containing protein
MCFFVGFIKPRVQRSFTKQSAKGFTLLELAVVMVCIGILSVAVAPTVRGYIRTIGLRNAVYQLSGDLYTIKSQAIRTSANCNIAFDPLLQTYTLSDPSRTVNLNDFHGNVTFIPNPDGGADIFSPTIAFNTRGLSALVPPATTQVYIRNQDNRIFRIQVSAVGAISIHKWASASSKWVR